MENSFTENNIIKHANQLKGFIQQYDGALFKVPLTVDILGSPPLRKGAIAVFLPERNFLCKLLGFKDQYAIFTHNLAALMSLGSWQLQATAIHEVRHRFQKIYPESILTEDSVKKHFTPALLDMIKKDVESYKENAYAYPLEYDAHIMNKVVWLSQDRSGFIERNILRLISCNPNTIGDVLTDITS